MTNCPPFVFYDNKLSNCLLSLVAASRKLQIHVSVRLLTKKLTIKRVRMLSKISRAWQWFQVFPRLVLGS